MAIYVITGVAGFIGSALARAVLEQGDQVRGIDNFAGGRRANRAALLAKFITQMLGGQQPTIFGDGEQSRDFTYIDNCVSANLLACTAPATKASGKVFNVACGERFTVNDTFHVLKELTGYKGEPAY